MERALVFGFVLAALVFLGRRVWAVLRPPAAGGGGAGGCGCASASGKAGCPAAERMASRMRLAARSVAKR